MLALLLSLPITSVSLQLDGGNAVCVATNGCSCAAITCTGTTCSTYGLLQCADSIEIGAGVTLRVTPWTAAGPSGAGLLTLEADVISVAQTAIIDGDAAGYTGTAATATGACVVAEGVNGNAYGPGYGRGGRCYMDSGGGGGYGGAGGNGSRDAGCATTDGVGGSSYDTNAGAVERGSGGGSAGTADGDAGGTGPAGGGGITLVGRVLNIAGWVRARGGNGGVVSNDTQGGGSGGGIALNASETIECGTTAIFDVRGGNVAPGPDDQGGAGGGGRIKILQGNINGACEYRVQGGTGGCTPGNGVVGGFIAVPTVSITAPTATLRNTAVSNVAGSAIAYGTATLPSGVTITLTDSAGTMTTFANVAVTSDAYNSAVNYTPAVQGLVTIRVTTTDSNNRTSVATRTYTYDSAPPTGTIVAQGVPAATGPISITGTFSDASTVSVATSVCNADCTSGCVTTARTQGAGTFSTSWPGTASQVYCARAVLTDAAGNARTVTHTFAVDKTPPTVEIDPDLTRISTAAGPYSVCISSTDNIGVPSTVATLAGTPVDVTFMPCTMLSGSAGDAVVTVPTGVTGSVQLSVTATDSAGNTASATRSFVIDNAAPALTLTSPMTGVSLRSTTQITGVVSDESGPIAVSIVYSQAAMGCTMLSAPSTPIVFSIGAPSGSFDQAPPLADGRYCAVVTAADALGNEATDLREFVLDATPPSVFLWTPAEPTTAEHPTVSGGASDASGLAASLLEVFAADASGACVPGALASHNVSGAFTLDPWPDGALADGKYCVVLTASDNAGNTSSATLVITKDSALGTLIVNVSPNPNTEAQPTATGVAPSGETVHVIFSQALANGGCSATADAEGDASAAGGAFSLQAPTALVHAAECVSYCVRATAGALSSQDRFTHCNTATSTNAPMTVAAAPATSAAAMQVSGTAPALATEVRLHVFATDASGACTLIEVGGGATMLQDIGGAQGFNGNTGTPLPLGDYCVTAIALQGSAELARASVRVTVAQAAVVAPTGTTGVTGMTGVTAATGPSGEQMAPPMGSAESETDETETETDTGEQVQSETLRVLGSGCRCNGGGDPASVLTYVLLVALYRPKRRWR